MKSDKQFVNTLEDNIRRHGAPTKLISDRAQVAISAKVKDILCALCISD
jgi:RNase P subunit RPR2